MREGVLVLMSVDLVYSGGEDLLGQGVGRELFGDPFNSRDIGIKLGSLV
jgi:hypothetical protein